MKITKRQLRRIIKEESKLTEVYSEQSAEIVDRMMTQLENNFYGKYPDEEVDEFAVEAMAILGQIEPLLDKLVSGGYSDDLKASNSQAANRAALEQGFDISDY